MLSRPQKILVRMPNWLGDMVMATSFLKAVKYIYPQSEIGVIIKKGLEGLSGFLPEVDDVIVFEKKKFSGVTGVLRFGKELRDGNWDIYFSLPDSFSSALMGFSAGIKHRVGYKKEFRSVLLTHSFKKPDNLHRVDSYLNLLKKFSGSAELIQVGTSMDKNYIKEDFIVLNINSEAVSRKLPIQKAKELIEALLVKFKQQIVLIGGPSDVSYVDAVLKLLPHNESIINKAGKTSLVELVDLIGCSKGMISTDSGPAHLANAVSVPLLVIFGAGNENETAPYNKDYLLIHRLGELPCEPCVKNTCKLAELPPCLIKLDMVEIVNNFSDFLNSSNRPV